MKRVMTYTAVVLATLAVLQILWQFRLALLLFGLSLSVAAVIRPFADWLVARGLSPVAAQVLLYVLGIGGILLIVLLLGDLLLVELNNAANVAVVEYESLHQRWEAGTALQETIIHYFPPALTFAPAEDSELITMLPAVVDLTRTLVGALGGAILLLALSVYWSIDQHRFERLWLSLLPAKRRSYARDAWREIETAVGSYLRSQIVQSVLAAGFLIVGALVAGVDYPLLFGFLGALAVFVPFFGGLVTTIIAFVLGSMTSSWIGIGMAVYTLVIFLFLEQGLELRIWKREQRSLLLMVLVIIALLIEFGIAGFILAPLAAIIIEVLIKQTYQAYVVRRQTAVHYEDLEARYQLLAQKIAHSENGEVKPELRNLTEKLATLLANTREVHPM
ncbi:MAG: AI-2E family transporter [Anaerolineales bacterium]|nr:AI-2E family transporter [Anaerolineales bacterium]